MATDSMNPIYEFAAQGQHREKTGQWIKAIDWYYKALSCLPNVYGSDEFLKHGLVHHQSSASFTPKHAARLYAALGRCLMKAGRLADSRLAATAAHSLDAAHVPALGPRDDVTSGTWVAPGGEKAVLKDDLTLVVVTHCASGLERFKSLSPPSTGLLTATYGSLTDVFGGELEACPKLLCYDRPAKETSRENIYMEGLGQFSRRHGFELHLYDRIGLFAILEQIVARIDTPYLLFVEHDWLFQGAPIQLSGIIGHMNRHNRINAVRFNKRENQIDGLDYILKVDRHEGACPLLHTSSHSNNPSVFRTAKLRDEWLPACRRALQRVVGELGGSAFGVEEILFRRHAEDIRRFGFDEAHRSWGTCVFGRAGDPARVVHLGE